MLGFGVLEKEYEEERETAMCILLEEWDEEKK
jgi:hypothetical protein